MTPGHEHGEWSYQNQGYLKLQEVVHSASNPKKGLDFIIGEESVRLNES